LLLPVRIEEKHVIKLLKMGGHCMLIEINSSIIKQLSKTELEVVKFINDNEDRLSELSIVDIAFDTYSSPSTVSRTIRKCGINGFNELRYRLASKVENQEIHDINEIMNKSIVEATAVIEHLSMTNLLSAIHCIRDTKEKSKRILVLARGPSELVAKELCMKLQVLDYLAMTIFDPQIMRIMSQNLQEGELVIILSLNGETCELIDAARNANARGISVITLCCSSTSALYEYSRYSLIGYKHTHVAIRNYDVTSRLPLQIICRIMIDYLVEKMKKENPIKNLC